MKIFKFLFTTLLLTTSATSFAFCPQDLSVQSTVDCIVTEAANEIQDDFRWDALANADQDDHGANKEHVSNIVAMDNE